MAQEEYLETLRKATDPESLRDWPPKWPGVQPVNALRPLLGRVRFLLMAEVPPGPSLGPVALLTHRCSLCLVHIGGVGEGMD